MMIKSNNTGVGATHGSGLHIYVLPCNSTLWQSLEIHRLEFKFLRYSFEGNMLTDVPKMQCGDRNLIGASGAIFDGWFYLAGGFKGSPSDVEPAEYLNLAEKLNLKTWEWQSLPPMHIPRAFGTGLALNNKFCIVGGGTTLKRSAEIYDPSKNSWQLLESFVPKEADGFAVASLNSRLLLLTWSNWLGVKLWMWNKLINLNIGGWRLISFFPNQQVERLRVRQYGARMVRVGKEVWVLVGENESVCQVDGGSAWPVFPAPMFRPDKGLEIVQKGHIYAFHFTAGGRISWRQIPVYSI
ncbi:hypothetical protein Pint_32374 [Pistacia integerrima]|uniref:Uncharacterized protein n=1 Tax=Pistacia integerrima TaxID=434235 RepID=A0ACC0XT48_9ROSI|nr:hypothetical protein Pint_32374 [Pistacia integerrima]